jgi:dTDP-4-amino-4,6-dideoxygalactose transaminase
MPTGGFDFCLIDKKIVDVLICSSEKNTSLVGLIIWAGFDRAYIEYDRAERPYGRSMWSFRKKIRYALNSIISFSSFPLRILGLFGITMGVICLCGTGFLVYHYFTAKITVPGWTSIIFLILGLSALQFIGFGILGEYFWHSSEQNRKRPLFIIDRKIGFGQEDDGANSLRNGIVPFFDNRAVSGLINNSLLESCSRVLRSNRLILGREVETFERELASYLGMKYAVGVANATDAITMALWAMGIKEGDRVITSAISAPATAVAILRAGAQPIFVDVEPRKLTISLAGIEKALKLGAKAIVPVHLYGNPCDIKEIMELAEKHKLVVVEDCAQSLGTVVSGAYCGTFGSISIFSFYPTKNLGGYGDGGALATNDPDVAERLRRMRFYGQNESGECIERGLNSRLDELQAALLSDRLKILDEQNSERKLIAERYDKELGFLNPVPSDPGRVPHLYVVRPKDRTDFRKFLSNHGIETGVHYSMPLAKHAHLSKYGINAGIATAQEACQHVVSLPCYPGLKNSHIEKVINICKLWEGSQK